MHGCTGENAIPVLALAGGFRLRIAVNDFTASLNLEINCFASIRAGYLPVPLRSRRGSGIHPIAYRSGKVLLTDGPFAETKEQLGGFIVIESARRELRTIPGTFLKPIWACTRPTAA